MTRTGALLLIAFATIIGCEPASFGTLKGKQYTLSGPDQFGPGLIPSAACGPQGCMVHYYHWEDEFSSVKAIDASGKERTESVGIDSSEALMTMGQSNNSFWFMTEFQEFPSGPFVERITRLDARGNILASTIRPGDSSRSCVGHGDILACEQKDDGGRYTIGRIDDNGALINERTFGSTPGYFGEIAGVAVHGDTIVVAVNLRPTVGDSIGQPTLFFIDNEEVRTVNIPSDEVRAPKILALAEDGDDTVVLVQESRPFSQFIVRVAQDGDVSARISLNKLPEIRSFAVTDDGLAVATAQEGRIGFMVLDKTMTPLLTIEQAASGALEAGAPTLLRTNEIHLAIIYEADGAIEYQMVSIR